MSVSTSSGPISRPATCGEAIDVVRDRRGLDDGERAERGEVVERLGPARARPRDPSSRCSTFAASSTASMQTVATSASPPGAAVRTPMRSGPTSAPTSSRNGRGGGAAAYGSPGIAPASTSSDGRAVADRARDHVANHEAAPRLTVVGPQRHASTRGLEAEQPAHAGGDADRPATVACVRERHHARRHRGARSRRSSRPGCDRGPTGCGWVRTRWARWWAGCPNSGAFVLPTMTNPAALSLALRYESWSAT